MPKLLVTQCTLVIGHGGVGDQVSLRVVLVLKLLQTLGAPQPVFAMNPLLVLRHVLSGVESLVA